MITDMKMLWPKPSTHMVVNKSALFSVMNLLNVFICLSASAQLLGNALPGVAMMCCALAWQTLFRLWQWPSARRPHARAWALALTLPAMLGLTLGLGVYFPAVYDARDVLWLGLLALLLCARTVISDVVMRRHYYAAHKRAAWLVAGHAACLLALAGLLYLARHRAVTVQTAVWFAAGSLAQVLWNHFFFARGMMALPIRDTRAARQIASFRVYQNTLFYAAMAFYLSILMYAGMIIFAPPVRERLLAQALVWAPLAALLLGAFSWLMRPKRLYNMDKGLLFVLGGGLWLVSAVFLCRPEVLRWAGGAQVWTAVNFAGLVCMWILLLRMSEDVRLVLALGETPVSPFVVEADRVRVQDMALLFSCLVMTVGFAALTLITQLDLVADAALERTVLRLFTLMPAVCALIGMVCALYQPLDRQAVRRLERYIRQKDDMRVNLAFEARLRLQLALARRRRVGVRLLLMLVKPLYPHRVRNADVVDVSDGPVIFVCNHRQLYGPVIANLYIPFSFRPWIEHNMLDRAAIKRHAWTSTFSRWRMPRFCARALMGVVLPLVGWALHSVDPIPVHRGGLRETVATINKTVEAMLEEDNILIFPEDPRTTNDGRYASEGVSDFYTGFAHVAKAYYAKSGKRVVFYPVYASIKARTLTFGDGVAYDSEAHPAREKKRIAEALRAQMAQMAREERLPKKPKKPGVLRRHR